MDAAHTIDAARFRQVLGHFPTGVTVITATHDEEPVGLAVGSFASVSLDPPLVGFFVGTGSSSWPRIEAGGSFCVNVLRDDQESLCRQFAGPVEHRFTGVGWTPSTTGSPMLDGALAWIDCRIERTDPAGDHLVVLGHVQSLELGDEGHPLVFFRGGYAGLAG